MSTTDAATRQVPCPSCGEPSVFAASNRWRPFCSARCAGVDLGAWASESFRVATPPSSEDESDNDGAEQRH
ncbi:MAG: DNA gyrase inhibitor YacG [Pseudomonadota bacterium]